MSLFDYLHQDTHWGRGDRAIPIASMDAAYRFNAARWLLKRATPLAYSYTAEEECSPLMPQGDMACAVYEDVVDERLYDSDAWLRGTELFQALVTGLPEVPTVDSPQSTLVSRCISDDEYSAVVAASPEV